MINFYSYSNIESECGSKNGDNGDSRMMLEIVEGKQLTCCEDCSMNLESEIKSSRSSSLPSWLAGDKIVINNQDKVSITSIKLHDTFSLTYIINI